MRNLLFPVGRKQVWFDPESAGIRSSHHSKEKSVARDVEGGVELYEWRCRSDAILHTSVRREDWATDGHLYDYRGRTGPIQLHHAVRRHQGRQVGLPDGRSERLLDRTGRRRSNVGVMEWRGVWTNRNGRGGPLDWTAGGASSLAGRVGSVDAFDFLAVVGLIEDEDLVAGSAGGYSDDDVALFTGKGVLAEIAEDRFRGVEEAGRE